MSTPTQSHSHSPAAPGDSDGELREGVREYVQRLRACQVHATVFAAGMVVILLVNLFTNKAAGISVGEWSAWWSAWALIGWGLGVAVHGFVVQLSRPATLFLVREEKQIDKVLASMDPESHR